MQRSTGHRWTKEIYLLWLLEFLPITLVLMYALGTPARGHSGVTATGAGQATVLAFAVSVNSVMVGLYNPETWTNLRGLAARVTGACLCSLPAILALSMLFSAPQPGTIGMTLLRITEIVVFWGGYLLASRIMLRDTLRRPAPARSNHDAYARSAAPTRRPQAERYIDLGVTTWDPDAAVVARGTVVRAAVRCIDIAESLGLLLLALPLMLLTAAAIRLESAGPVFYRQERVGEGGVPFMLLKFRSMRIDAEAAGPAWASQHDPRVTRIGGFLRATRIDELPQLLNVLAGNMSLVGPRPERPCFVSQINAAVPLFAERTRIKPGITGWAQVNCPYGASIEDARQKLSYDLYYMKNRSLLLDARIMLATVRVVLFKIGAR